MPRIRRRFLIEPSEVGVYHCINRYVRRSFLCGTDQTSGKSDDHRKQWLQDSCGLLGQLTLHCGRGTRREQAGDSRFS